MRLSLIHHPRSILLLLAASLLVLTGCGTETPTPLGPLGPGTPRAISVASGPGAAAPASDDLAALSDDFDNATSLRRWQDHAVVEGWPSMTEQADVNTTAPGQLYLVPRTCTWFEDYHGVYLFKTVTGDFDVTTRIQATGKTTDLPQRTFSLTGLMVRAPRAVTPQTWKPGGENWVFITTGYGDNAPGRAGRPQIETKTTQNSKSHLTLIRSQSGWVYLRVVRVDTAFLMLYSFDGQEWYLSQRFTRPDLPKTVQVGLNAYTNWESIPADVGTANLEGVPNPTFPADLVVHSDYVHFQRPRIDPSGLAQANLSTLSNDGWLKLLGIK
jgi:hypothetical protein